MKDVDIARMIGMIPTEDEGGYLFWQQYDQFEELEFCCYPAGLEHYLISGDRPLRIMEAIKPRYNIEITCDDDRWRIWIHPDKYAEGKTLALAIWSVVRDLEEPT